MVSAKLSENLGGVFTPPLPTLYTLKPSSFSVAFPLVFYSYILGEALTVLTVHTVRNSLLQSRTVSNSFEQFLTV